jgi:hypothetical protein
MNADLLAAVQKLGFTGLDETVGARLEKIVSVRATKRADEARAREYTKARAEQLEPRVLVKALGEALLPGQKRRGRKPRTESTDGSSNPADSVGSAEPGASEPAEKGVSGVQDA